MTTQIEWETQRAIVDRRMGEIEQKISMRDIYFWYRMEPETDPGLEGFSEIPLAREWHRLYETQKMLTMFIAEKINRNAMNQYRDDLQRIPAASK